MDIARPKPKIIFILGIESNDELIMSDGGETCTGKSGVIFWDIDPKSGVAEIVDIEKKENSPNVFKERPSKEANSKKWKGNIKDEFDEETLKHLDPETKSITELYTIYYIKTSGEKGIYDPKIQVKS